MYEKIELILIPEIFVSAEQNVRGYLQENFLIQSLLKMWTDGAIYKKQ